MGHSKPCLDEFLLPLVAQLLDLECGFAYENTWYKFFLLFAVFDKPARALVLNTKLASSYFGCIKCEIKGESVPYGHGNHIVFKNIGDLRSNLSYLNNIKACIQKKKKSFKGVKGICLLTKLKHFQPFVSTIIDVMHSVFLGVVKNLFYYLFDAPVTNSYSLKSKISVLNKKLTSIRPPNFIQQAPRKLEEYKKWRSHEFMNFILFFAIPLFKDEMAEVYFQHLLLLIIPLEYLLSKKIKIINLEVVDLMLKSFVTDAEKLYDVHFLSSGVHELLHLVKCTIEMGPLNIISCYPYEELNRKITRFIKGQDLVGDEFIKLWGTSKNLNLFVLNNFPNDSNDAFVMFLRKNFLNRSSNIKNKTVSNFILKLGKNIKHNEIETNLIVEKFEHLFHKENLDLNNKVTFYDRIRFNNLLYSTLESNTKFCNCVISYENQFCLIKHIVKIEDEIFFICKKLIHLANHVSNINFNILKSHFSFYSFSPTLISIHYSKLNCIKKHFLYDLHENNLCLISTFTSNHLFS